MMISPPHTTASQQPNRVVPATTLTFTRGEDERCLRFAHATGADAPAIAACIQRVHREPGARLRPFPDDVRAGGPAAAAAYVDAWNRPDLGRHMFIAVDAESGDVVSTQLIDRLTRENTLDASGRGHPGGPFVRVLEGLSDPTATTALSWSGVVAADDAARAPQQFLPAPAQRLDEAIGEHDADNGGVCEPTGKAHQRHFRWDREGGEMLLHFGRATTAADLRGFKCHRVGDGDAEPGALRSLPPSASSCYDGSSVNEALRVFGIRQVHGVNDDGDALRRYSFIDDDTMTRLNHPLGNVVFTYTQLAGGPLMPTACRAVARYSRHALRHMKRRNETMMIALRCTTTPFASPDALGTSYTHRVVVATVAEDDEATGRSVPRVTSSTLSLSDGTDNNCSSSAGEGASWPWAGRCADASPQRTPSPTSGTTTTYTTPHRGGSH